MKIIFVLLYLWKQKGAGAVEKNSKLLFDEEPIVLSRALSRILGANKAIALQQIHYWCEKSKSFVNPSEHFIDGKWWVYNTYEEWTRQFCIGSERTVRRVLKDLESKGLLLVANHNKDKHNRTNWYAINHEKLDELYDQYNGTVPTGQSVNPSGQVVKMVDNVSTCTTGQVVKRNDKVTSCIKSPENTQSLSEITSSIDIFKTYTENPKLLIALDRFCEMRIEVGKKLTVAATRMLLEDLDSFTNSDDEKVLILKKSVLNNWKEIFPLFKPMNRKNDDAGMRMEMEMKQRGEYNLESSTVNPDDYYDWIGERKRKLELE